MGTLRPLATSYSTVDNGVVMSPGMVIVLAFAAVATVLWLWMLIDALVRPVSAWRAADRSPMVWALVLILLGWIGGLLYVTIARPSLRRAASAA